MTAFDTYRKMLTSQEDVESAWWYLGTTTAIVEGHPEIIVNHVETVMVYGSQDLPDGGYRVPWWEIGIFRDAITGELPTTWFNPVTGVTATAPRMFEEGPSGFSIRPTSDGGVEMFDAIQAMANLESATIDVREIGDRVCVTQTEFKTRSFPDTDGIPDISAGKASRSKTILQFLSDRADLESGMPSVPSTGFYSLEMGAPDWLGFGDIPVRFGVKGLMHKAPMNDRLNPRGWEDMKKLYSQYFDGDIIQPRWK